MNSAMARKLIYAGTLVALVGTVGGMAVASVLTSTMVNQGASFYEGGNSGANGYSSPSLQVAYVPNGVSSCTSGTATGATNAGTTDIVLSSVSGGTVCTAGDFAEEFTLSFSATIDTQTNVFTVTTQVGAGTVEMNGLPVALGTGSTGAFTQTVDVYVDYGSVNPPAAGVTVLDLVIQ